MVVVASELHVVNPATLERVATVPTAAPVDVQRAVDAAARAQQAFAESTLAERAALLVRLGEVVLAAADEIADTVVAETAKPRTEAVTSELLPALDAAAFLVREAPRVLRPRRLPARQPYLKHKRTTVVREPLGVVAVVSPWNFPFAIPFTQVAYALAAGNAAVLKPSPLAPLSGALVARLVADAGAPAALVQVVQGTGEVGEALVEADGVAKVLFTGSPETGRRVAAAAGARLVPVTLELGGKDAMLVLDDADLHRAVEGALWGSFSNCGQVCSGIERVYVEGALFEPFAEELARRARELRLGVDVGPLVSEPQRRHVSGLVEDALARGGRALAGARAPERAGFFYEPTVLVDVPGDARIEREEIFGPVVTVRRAADEAAAVRAANDSGFGLGASVWTRDRARAHRVAARLRAGSVWQNDHVYSYAASQAPWGGGGRSGYGRTHGREGLHELTAAKVVDADTGRVGVPWWFPYEEGTAAAFAGAARALYGRGRVRAAWRERRSLLALAGRYRT